MNVNDAIKDIMNNEGIRQVDLQKALGFKSQSRISTILKSDIKVTTLTKILAAVGYTLIIKKDSKEYIIDETE